MAIIRTYNMATKKGMFYDRFADWFKLVTKYLVFTHMYQKKLTAKLWRLLLYLHYVIYIIP